MASARPRSTMTLPYSTRLTMPLTISPTRSLYSSNWRSRSPPLTSSPLPCVAFSTERGQGLGDEVYNLCPRVAVARVLQRNLGRLQGHVLDHFEQPGEPDLPGL